MASIQSRRDGNDRATAMINHESFHFLSGLDSHRLTQTKWKRHLTFARRPHEYAKVLYILSFTYKVKQ